MHAYSPSVQLVLTESVTRVIGIQRMAVRISHTARFMSRICHDLHGLCMQAQLAMKRMFPMIDAQIVKT